MGFLDSIINPLESLPNVQKTVNGITGELGVGNIHVAGVTDIQNPSILVEKGIQLTKSRVLPSWVNVTLNSGGLVGSVLGTVTNEVLSTATRVSAAALNDILGSNVLSDALKTFDIGKFFGFYSVKPLGSFIKPTTPGTEATDVNSVFSKFTFARPTKYEVSVFAPTAIGDSRNHTFQCVSASMPGKSFSTFDVRRGSPIQTKLPYDNIYDELRLTFRLSDDHSERTFFENWHNYIYDEANAQFRFAKSYYGTIEVTQLTNDLNKSKTIRCVDVFPTNISSIELSFDTTDTIATFEVQFAYRQWSTI